MNYHFNIEKFLSLDGYATDERVARRKTNDSLAISNTNEFYTPYSIVKKMGDKISEEKWKDVNANFLEPSMGNGQFICYIIWNKIMHGSTWQQALEHTWGVELMSDNVKETHERIIDMLHLMDVADFDEIYAKKVITNNLVRSDFFKWDFENWCPIDDGKSVVLF